MGNKVNALDETKFKQRRAMQLIVEISMRDGQMDGLERELYDLSSDVAADVDFELSKANYKAGIEKLTRHDAITYYQNTLARPLGFKMVSLDAERGARSKVVSFPTRDYGA